MTTEAEQVAWKGVRAFLEGADSIAFDGCHKIYILRDPAGTKQQRSLGYGDGTDSSELVYVFDNADAALEKVQGWFENSCGLRFVNGIKGTGEENDHYVRLIGQGEEEEWEESEQDCTCHDLPADEPCGLHG